jgi:hypothetical protein
MRHPHSLLALAEWLGSFPANKTYNYLDNERCLNCRYLRSLGHRVWFVGYHDWRDKDRTLHPLPAGFDAVAQGDGQRASWTYGAAAARARAAAGVVK